MSLSPPILTSGVTGMLESLPASLFPSACVDGRSHRRPTSGIVPTGMYNQTIASATKDARASLIEMAARGELSSPDDVSEEQLEEMDMDADLLRDDVLKLKQRLSIKIRDQEALEARRRIARKSVAANIARIKAQRLATLRVQRSALMRQKSEESAREDPPTDLTTQGIEPNPYVNNASFVARASD